MGTPVAAPGAHPVVNPNFPPSSFAGTTASINYHSDHPSHMGYTIPVSSPSSSAPHFTVQGLPSYNSGTNPYVTVSPVPGSPAKSPVETIFKVLGRCGKKLEDTTKRASNVAGNVWYHLKTSRSPTDAAMAKLAQGTKVLAEGGIDRIFQQTFGNYPGEQLRKAFACYLSTSSGPVIGTLYLSTARIAFCSDNPLYRNASQGQQEWIYYKVIVCLDQLRAVNPSANTRNPTEKYIQIVTMDNHEFWFIGFVSYEKALKNLMEAVKQSHALGSH